MTYPTMEMYEALHAEKAELRARIERLQADDELREAAFQCYVDEQKKDRARIEQLEALLRHADKVVIWEHTPARPGFQEEIEAALSVGRRAKEHETNIDLLRALLQEGAQLVSAAGSESFSEWSVKARAALEGGDMSDCGHLALIASGEARGLCPLCQRARIEWLRAALEPFAALLDTHSNGYESSADDEVVRSVGTLGRDYAFITVADLRRASAALARKEG